MDFEFIYSTVRLDGSEFGRPLAQIRCVLAKAYELANLPLFEEEDNRIFDPLEDGPFSIHRTRVERMLLAIDTLPTLDTGLRYSVASRSTELTIDHLHGLEILLKKLPGTEHELYGAVVFAGWLRAHLQYLVDTARHGVVSTNQNAILEQLYKIPDNAKKVVYLKQVLLSYKQQKDNYDKQHYEALYNFLKLEKKKWALNVDDSTPHFSTAAELLGFVSGLITTEVEHYIRQQGGYKNFWRDEQCTDDKKETEVQQYILAILAPACRQKSIKIHREVFAADGSVDMTFTYLNLDVCMEIKKAQHPDVDKAMNKQLVAYMQAERTTAGIYLVLWYKSAGGISLPSKYPSSQDLRDYLNSTLPVSYKIEPHVIDCTKPISPSKQR
jgi:hypothetical protein